MPDDQWAPFNYKSAMASVTSSLGISGQWVPPGEERRQIAYRICTGFKNNTAGRNIDQPDYEHRQYGDPAMLNDLVVDGMLSDELSFNVHGRAEPTEPDLGERPGSILPALGPAALRLNTIKQERYDAAALSHVERYEADLVKWERATVVQDYVDRWVVAEDVRSKIWETEREFAVPLGDGVQVFGWNTETGRPSMTVYPAESYFPVIETDARQFPKKVHLVWEEPGADGSSEFLHRVTYRLGDIEDEAGNVLTRTMPWGEDTTQTCYRTHKKWPVGNGNNWMKLDPKAAKLVDAETDLGFNFIPIVHIPNTPSSTFHYGRSMYGVVAQLFDDIAQFDKDIAAAAALAATPMFAIEGGNLPAGYSVKAGAIWPLPLGAKPHKIDVSANLSPLLAYELRLNERLATNSRVGTTIMGRSVSTASGYRVKLEMTPFEQMIEMMRMVRRNKYSLMFKMVQRLAMYGETLEAGEVLPVDIHFGPAIPTDGDAVVARVKSLLAPPAAISLRTASLMLQQANIVPVDDLDEELARIASEDFDGADDLASAVSVDAAADYLGVAAAGAVEPPTTVLPDLTLDGN
jgi:hypothetical protein